MAGFLTFFPLLPAFLPAFLADPCLRLRPVFFITTFPPFLFILLPFGDMLQRFISAAMTASMAAMVGGSWKAQFDGLEGD